MESNRSLDACARLRSLSRAWLAACAVSLACALMAAPAAAANSSHGADPVLATVDGHPITQSEVDAHVIDEISPNQRYELRKRALDSMVDQYLIDRAAKKAHMTPAAYLDHELHPKGSTVTEADARKYYNAHKAALDAQTGHKPYEQIQAPLISALQRHYDSQRRDALMDKLRADNHVKVMLEAPREQVASAGHPWTGGKDAPVTVVEFSDFQCPFCRAAEPTLKQIRAKYGDRIKFVYMDFPLGMHPHALDAAVAGRCAAQQDKFWQFHDAMFADQGKLDPASLKQTAAKLGLDAKKFDACFDEKKVVAGIRADQAEGERLGVTGTPTFFINGRQMVGVESQASMAAVIDEELARAEGAEKTASTAATAHPAKTAEQ